MMECTSYFSTKNSERAIKASPTSLKVVMSWLGFVMTIPAKVSAHNSALYLMNLPLMSQTANTSSYTAKTLIRVVAATAIVKKAGRNPTHSSGYWREDIPA